MGNYESSRFQNPNLFYLGGDKWHQATVYINRRASPFLLKFKVERRRNAKGDISVDDIKFANCSITCKGVSNTFLCSIPLAYS